MGGRGYSFMHGRKSINPCAASTPGRSTSGFYRPGRHCLHQARGAVRSSPSCMQRGLHPTKNRLQGGLRHIVPTFLHVDGNIEQLHV